MDDFASLVAALRPANACRELRRTEHSVFHRLRSIAHDREFVDAVQSVFPELPLFANLRCGVWYHPQFAGTCYFKSTDGHRGKWDFSFSRPNLHIAFQAARSGGLVIVDSTRKGKEFPDSLSRTVPVWAAVVNRAVANVAPQQGGDLSEWRALRMPSWVNASEKDQIECRMDAWEATLRTSGVDLASLSQLLSRPLKCLWLSWTNFDSIGPSTLRRLREHCTPLVLVSVSYGADAKPANRPGWTYVQGAGDDHQAWSLGLTPQQFWEHKSWLVDDCDDEAECQRRVADVLEGRAPPALQKVTSAVPNAASAAAKPIGETGLYIAAASAFQRADFPAAPLFALLLNCSSVEWAAEAAPPAVQQCQHCFLPVLRAHKHHLERQLQRALTAINGGLQRGNVCLVCDTGTTISPAMAVAALVLLYDAQHTFVPQPSIDLAVVRAAGVTKASIRRCLTFVASHLPEACPDRNLMKQVNRFFLVTGSFATPNFEAAPAAAHQNGAPD
eukprot:GGOE01037833.1.p1 GENE.GGOE01037833.1~~GGOE01037833.1.p1  ORF type:complete len:501 (-),score=121.58 GGOE01037833.1:96-1598(-)